MADDSEQDDFIERLRPVHISLRSDLQVSRHLVHGEAYYVVRDPVTSQSHNVSSTDYHVLIRLDDSKSLGETFDELSSQGVVAVDEEEHFFSFILKLQYLGLLHLPVANGRALFARHARRLASRQREKLTGLLFYRVPLIGPDNFLERTVKYTRPLFTHAAFGIWLLLMLASGFVLWARWDDFVSPLQSLLATRNLLCMWVLLVGLKVFHEFGHAYACKVFGGKVPEMGAFFVLLTPCAYVDASSAWGFPSRKHRIIVSLAGMYFESFIAAIAVFVWAFTAPSILHSCAHQTVILAGVITCVMNLNPLMRYDGYYVLSDALNIPNLRGRSQLQVHAILKRIFLGIRLPKSPHSRSMQSQLFVYGIAAMQYKVILVLGISAMIALKFGAIGLVGAAAYLGGAVFGGCRKLITYLWTSPETQQARKLSLAYSLVLLLGVPVGLFAIPFAQTKHMSGVLAASQETHLYAGTSGFLVADSARLATHVAAGDVVCRLENSDTAARTLEAQAELQLCKLRSRIEQYRHLRGVSPTATRLSHKRELLDEARREEEGLVIRAPVAGAVLAGEQEHQPGRFVNEGEHVATIVAGDWIVRSFATAEDIADMQAQIGKDVQVRLIADVACQIRGTVASISQVSSSKAAAASLRQSYGNQVAAARPTGELGEPYFEVVVHIDEQQMRQFRHGMSVRIDYETGSESYSRRAIRKCRQFVNKLLVM